jgi:hypothetical protein
MMPTHPNHGRDAVIGEIQLPSGDIAREVCGIDQGTLYLSIGTRFGVARDGEWHILALQHGIH